MSANLNTSNQEECLNLPTAVVTRIVKEALPEGCSVAREAKLALARAASVFVLYLTSQANNVAAERNKKTIANRDVLEALQLTEFGRFEEPLAGALERFRQVKEVKKARKNEESMNNDISENEVIDVEDRSDNEAVDETNEEVDGNDEIEEVDMEEEQDVTS